MVLLNCDDFLEELAKLITEESGTLSKSLWITYKRYIPNTRRWKRTRVESKMEVDEDPVCLVRAKIGKRKISTHVPASVANSFTDAINDISDLMKN